jgi:ribonuclease M5
LCEGKYDKIKLSSVLDAMILTTDGFSVFNNSEKRSMISRISRERGLVIITDSDKAGVFIRRKLKGMLPADADIRHIYIPEIAGKEKRKDKASKDGLLGVEGMSAELLRKLLVDSGIAESNTYSRRAERITKAQLFSLGLSGNNHASDMRKIVCKAAGLPSSLTANALLEALYMLGFSYSDLCDMISKIHMDGGAKA